MAAKGRKRKIFLCSGIVLVGLGLLVLALPLWFPWIVRPLSRRADIVYGTYERHGYGRFILHDAHVTNESVRFRAEKVEVLLPTTWVWDKLFQREFAEYVRAEGWTLEFLEGRGKPTREKPSTLAFFRTAEKTVTMLKQWLPKATLRNGTVGLAFGKQADSSQLSIRLPTVNWTKGALSAEIERSPFLQGGRLRAQFEGAPYDITFDSAPLQLHLVTRITPSGSKLILESTSQWGSNRAEATAQFGRESLLPERADVSAKQLTFPGALLGAIPWREVTGGLSFHWQDNQFTLNVNAAAPAPLKSKLPPIEMEVRATGNTERVFIEKAKVALPWLEARFTPATEILLRPPFLKQEAKLASVLHLQSQSWFTAKGDLRGEIRLSPASGRFPSVAFDLSGGGVEVSEILAKIVNLNGKFVWPLLDISQLSIGLADGSKGLIHGQFNVDRRIVREGQLRFEGPFGAQFLPSGFGFKDAVVEAECSGTLEALTHSGRILVREFVGPNLRPLGLQADWRGLGQNLQTLHANVIAGVSSLELEGSLLLTNNSSALLLKTLSLKQKERSLMELQSPCRFSYERTASRTNESVSARYSLSPFHWSGASQAIALEGQLIWPTEANLSLNARSVDLEMFAPFLKLPQDAIRVGELAAKAGWTNGPVCLDLNCSASVVHDGIPVSIETRLKCDSGGISIERLEFSSSGQPGFSARGLVPVVATPAEPNRFFALVPGIETQLHAATQTNSLFWAKLADLTGVSLIEPRLNVDVSGPWESLSGSVQAHAKKLDARNPWPLRTTDSQTVLPGPKPALPTGPRSAMSPDTQSKSVSVASRSISLENLQLSLQLDRNFARLRQLKLLLEGQPVLVMAELPLARNFWRELVERKAKPDIDWKKAKAEVTIENARIAALASFAPKVLGPEGTLKLALSVEPGLKFVGALELEGANTQPLGSFGRIRDIAVKARFENQTLELESLTASLAGAPLSATGRIELDANAWRKGELPPFQLTLRALNVPVARSPDFIVRTDLAATVAKTNSKLPIISGKAELRDSFFLHDLQELLPGGVNSPAQRPPYFSITDTPWADWQLNLALKGRRFLKVYSPLFRGVLSADLRLTGTLAEPIALGSLKIDSGAVQFPFANLNVTQGFVTLASDNPYRPQLLLRASARNGGYDIKMDASGPADQPLVQFSSTPPLTSEQVVLMLTAGVLPSNETSLPATQRAGRVALFVGKSFLSQLGLVDEGDRLTVRTGEEISETGQPTYHIEYKLSERWYLVGERDQFNQYNAGFKWTIYSK